MPPLFFFVFHFSAMVGVAVINRQWNPFGLHFVPANCFKLLSSENGGFDGIATTIIQIDKKGSEEEKRRKGNLKKIEIKLTEVMEGKGRNGLDEGNETQTIVFPHSTAELFN